MTLAPVKSEPVDVAAGVARFPDWGADGGSLVYVETPQVGKDSPGVVLGVLTQRAVLDAKGRIALAEDRQFLAGIVFSPNTRVRCLSDGRIVFNAIEMSLPMAAADYEGDHREQLFAVDAGRHSTLVRLVPRGQEADLPQLLAFFDISQDEKQLVFGGVKSEVAVLTLASGEVDLIQPAGDETFDGLPSWRRPGELCYVRRTSEKQGAKSGRPAEIVLREGDKDVVLSREWPAELLDGVASQSRR